MNHGLHPLLVDSLEIKSMRLGLDRMQAMDYLLGRPSHQFSSLHVAGTNGKGSVTTKIAHALLHGKKIGLYTSPHIETYRERIQIDSIPIPEDRAETLLEKIVTVSEEKLSYFELLTLVAFCYFADEKVDFAVIETGMGGRLDATNIVDPVLSVITTIDYDHMTYLGSSFEAIASEKGGIIKPNVPVLLGPQAKPLHIFESIAQHMKSPLFQVTGSFSNYEEENKAVAQKALTLLPFHVELKSIERGLEALPPCRFEVLSHQNPIVVLDVAHNPESFRRTFERFSQTYPNKPIRVVAGFSADKAIDECMKIINQNAVAIHLTHTDHFRLAKIGDPIEKAIEKAYCLAKKNKEILLVCGTFFIMHPARIAAKSMLQKGGG